jgi:hypothetical protein
VESLKGLSLDEEKKIIEDPDKYGNTPLLLACIRRYQEANKQKQQLQVVKKLIS